MKHALLIVALVFFGSAQAQDWRNTEWGAAYLRENNRDSTRHEMLRNADDLDLDVQANTTSGRVHVDAVGEAARLMRDVPTGSGAQQVTAYRVEIFNDNTATARERAYEAYSRFRELHPDIEASESRDIRYDSPKYTVRVGAFLTHDEAAALCGRLRSSFKAYVRTETMPLSIFSK